MTDYFSNETKNGWGPVDVSSWLELGYVSEDTELLPVYKHPVYGVKTSGDQQEFDTGAVRDSQDGKLRYDLIDPMMLARLAEVMREGATHYGEFNWTKGIPSQRYMASLLRHVFAYYNGDNSEDHLAAAVFNIMGIMRNEGTELDDLFEWGQS